MVGRTCVVTGATSGIGEETARGLARLGATVVLAVRDPRKGEAVREEIVRDTANPRVDVMRVDLSSQASIRDFAAAFKAKSPHLHVLVNNAGIYTSRRTLTPEGFESTFAINHLGSFLLTNLLLDLLRSSAPARIVNVSSGAHAAGHIDFEDLQREKRFRGWGAYSQSKLANVLFTNELARRLEGTGVTVNAVHPGVVRTHFASNGGLGLRIGFILMAPFMRSPAKGAETSIFVASSPELEGVTGKYFVNRAPAQSSPASHDEGVSRRLWDVSARLTGLA
jgi:NAD(P)-dependent dehydrogenase (short-subunit alcohol dehydrogenase family)